MRVIPKVFWSILIFPRGLSIKRINFCEISKLIQYILWKEVNFFFWFAPKKAYSFLKYIFRSTYWPYYLNIFWTSKVFKQICFEVGIAVPPLFCSNNLTITIEQRILLCSKKNITICISDSIDKNRINYRSINRIENC